MKAAIYPILLGALLTTTASQAYWGGPAGAAPWPGPPLPPVQEREFRQPQAIRVRLQRTEQDYIVDIGLRGIKPADVEILRDGRWIVIGQARTAEESHAEPGAYSYYHSFNSFSRRLSLPRDADPDSSHMKREDGTDSIRLSIPRIDYLPARTPPARY